MNATEVLNAIEVVAERAIPQELVNMFEEVQLMHSVLDGEKKEHADALLLKLDQLYRNQQVVPLGNNAQETGAVALIAVPCDATGIPAIVEVEEVLSAA